MTDKLTPKEEIYVVVIAIVVVKAMMLHGFPMDEKASLGIRLADRLMNLDLNKDEDTLVREAKAELHALILSDSHGS